MLRPKLQRSMFNRNCYIGSVAGAYISRGHRGGAFPLIPIAAAVAPVLIDGIRRFFSGNGLMSDSKVEPITPQEIRDRTSINEIMMKSPEILGAQYFGVVRHGMLRGSGWFSNLITYGSKIFNGMKDKIKPFFNKAKDTISNGWEFGKNIYNAVKTKDLSKVNDLIDQGKTVLNKTISLGKDTFNGVMDARKIYEQEKKTLADKRRERDLEIARQSEISDIIKEKESTNAENTAIASKIATETNLVPAPTEGVNTGGGMLTRLMNKKMKKTFRGKGFLVM